MSAPSQQFPPWLTQIISTITDANGIPVTTSTTVMYLPLTYYGPSIPLGTDWVYGGLTSPASTSTVSASSQTTTISTTNSATSSSTSLTSSPTSATPSTTSSSSILSSSSPPNSSQPSSSSTSSSSPTASSSGASAPSTTSGLERGQLVGIIIGSILGAIALFLFGLIFCLRRRRRSVTARSESPIDSEPILIETEDAFSPRASGEEADPFLQPSTRSRRRTANTNSLPSSHSSGASGYGTLLDRPTIAIPESPHEEDRYDRPLQPWQLHSLEEEDSVLPSDDEPAGHYMDFGLVPPRRVQAQGSAGSSTDGEEPQVATARRVTIDGTLASPETRTLPLEAYDPGPSPRPGRGAGGLLGLTSLAGLGRFSWFSSFNTSSRRNSAAERDLESNTALLDNDSEMSEARPRGLLGLGLTTEGNRPISSVSGRSARSGTSAGTVYHDANSSLSGTPVITPPPRALAQVSQAELGVRWASNLDLSHAPRSGSPLASPAPAASSDSPQAPRGDTLVDILDTPAPRALSDFGSTSSTKVASSSNSSPITPRLRQDSHAPSMGSFGTQSDTTQVDHGITIDVLEEEPPSAGEKWKAMATEFGLTTGLLGGPGNRTTFGLPHYVRPEEIHSEQGSLHSMRSHLSPTSTRSTGSAAASRRDLSLGSGSSHSHPRSKNGTSGSSSLAHSGSITSDGRKTWRPTEPISPAVSAFGPISPVSSPEQVHLSDPEPGYAVVMDQSPSDRSQSPPLSPLLMSPWVGGLDKEWQPIT